MKQYAAIDHALKLDEASLLQWIDRAWTYTRELPPKLKPPSNQKSKAA